MSDQKLATNYDQFCDQYRYAILDQIHTIGLARNGAMTLEVAVLVHSAVSLVDSGPKREAMAVQLLDDLRMDKSQEIPLHQVRLSEPNIDDSSHASFYVYCDIT